MNLSFLDDKRHSHIRIGYNGVSQRMLLQMKKGSIGQVRFFNFLPANSITFFPYTPFDSPLAGIRTRTLFLIMRQYVLLFPEPFDNPRVYQCLPNSQLLDT